MRSRPVAYQRVYAVNHGISGFAIVLNRLEPYKGQYGRMGGSYGERPDAVRFTRLTVGFRVGPKTGRAFS